MARAVGVAHRSAERTTMPPETTARPPQRRRPQAPRRCRVPATGLLLAAGATVLLGACSSGGDGAAPAAGATSAPAGTSSPAPAGTEGATGVAASPTAPAPSLTSPTPAGPTASTSTPTAGSGGSAADVPKRSGAALKSAGSARTTISYSISAGGQTQQASGTGVQDFRTDDAQLVLKTMGQSLETRVVGGTTYTKLPAGAARGGKTWLKAGSAGSTSGLSDPTQAFQVLGDSLGSVKDLGSARVGGVATTHYSTVVDLSKATSGSSALAPAKELGVTKIPLQIWVDQQGRPRQISESFSGKSAEAGTVALKLTLTYTDFGVPVKVTAPPASQVTTSVSGAPSGT